MIKSKRNDRELLCRYEVWIEIDGIGVKPI